MRNNHRKNAHKSVVKNLLRPLGFIAVVLLLILFLAPIFSGTIVKSVAIPFTIQKVLDPTSELGDTQTKQMGIEGMKKVTYSEPQSLLNIVFGGSSKSKMKQKSAIVTKQPVQNIISSGTRKYQYMFCSNGTYRYYTDDQFKAPSTGFTHKSPDNCAQSHQGTETQLADTPPRVTTSNTSPVSIPFSSFSIPSCTTTSIPYGIDYQNVSWLPTGKTQTYPGLNGTYFSCLGTSVQPLNEIVYTGTGTDYNAVAQDQARALARQTCTTQYNSVMAQINAAGAGSSSAVDVVQRLYSQCLSAAG